MDSFRFQDPLWLSLLLPLAAMIIWRESRRPNPAVIFSNVAVFRDVPKTWAVRLLPAVRGAIYLGLILAIIALARPQRGQEDFRVRSEGIAMAICLDRSGSMEAMDFHLDGKRANRFEVVKKIFRDFVLGSDNFSGRPDDQIALISFGGYVDSLCPLTLDHETLAETLDLLKLPEPLVDASGRMIRSAILEQESATAIGDALTTAVESLKDSKSKSNVIILLSDGSENTGAVTSEEAAKAAKTYGIRVYTIGIGSSGMAPFPAIGPDGRRGFINQPVEFDEAALRFIAKTTGGAYFNARDTDALAKICAEIDQLEKTTHEDRVFTKYRELYPLFLLPTVILLLVGTVLLRTRLKTLPD